MIKVLFILSIPYTKKVYVVELVVGYMIYNVIKC